MPKGHPAERMTQSRYEWLTHVEQNGPVSRDGWRNMVPNHCARLGWTAHADEAAHDYRAVLTDSGRAALRLWRAIGDALAARTGKADACDHDWRDDNNAYVSNTAVCVKCHTIMPADLVARTGKGE